MVQSDTLRIAEIYRRSGRYDVRVTPEIIEQPNNRVDLVFTVDEGAEDRRQVDRVRRQQRLLVVPPASDVIKTHESNLLSFLGSNDIYDPDRVEADRDLIRRFYLKNGFADVQVVAALTEYDPERKGFLVTFKIEEGQQYRVGSVDFHSSITNSRRAIAARLFARQCRLALQRRSGREVGRGNADRGLAPRLCVRRRASARRPQFRCPYRVGGVSDRRGSADLYRAHQHPRQHPHPRLRDPPRVRYLRRRRL